MTDTKTNQKRGKESANKLDLRNEIQEEYRSSPVPWFQWVFEHLDLPRSAQILELGGGPGTLWQENRSRLPRRWNVILSDQSRGMVRSAQENLDHTPVTGYLCLDGQHIPFPDDYFDAVLAIGVLDLIPDVQAALAEIWRVLRPAGVLFASAGGRRHLNELEELLHPYIPNGKASVLGGNEERFGMENGAQVLAESFQEVFRHDYHDRLVFDSIQPILDYVLSEDTILEALTLQQLGRFFQHLKIQLAKQGEIDVTIEKGLFIARKKLTA